jgi:hypothetical protein
MPTAFNDLVGVGKALAGFDRPAGCGRSARQVAVRIPEEE